MNPMNECRFIGRMVRTLELHYTQSNTAVTSFSLAVDRGRPDANDEWPSDFIDCVAWGTLAEKACKKFAKGDQIIICGRLQIRPYTDREGNKRRATEIMVDAARKLTAPTKNMVPSVPPSDAEPTTLENLPDDAATPPEFEDA